MKATLYAVAAAAATALSRTASAATPAQWRSKSIYQVLTDRFARTDGSTTATCNTEDRVYCGGTYQGIINRLDYIQGMGFSAIWISPVVKNLPEDTGYGEAYHGYWQQDLYSLNPHFGTADDLKNLAAELHDRDMYLMVDVVVNHNGWAGSASSVDYSRFNPFNSRDYYHSACTVDYNSQDSVEDCWLGDNTVALVDINTDDSRVVEGYKTWISQLVKNYSIDGLRIDTAKHVDKSFYPGFQAAAGVFSTGEVFDGNPSYTCDYQNYLDSVLNYPIYYPLTRAFTSPSGSISDLVNMINTLKSGCKDTTLLGTFSENHDITRFAAITSDLSQAKNVLTFNILADGIPIIYAGQEQRYAGVEDPNNREATWLSDYNTDAELYKLLASANAIRTKAIADDERYLTYQNWVIYSDSTTIAMRKGYDGSQVITVLSNKGANGDGYTLNLGNTGYTSGTQLVEVYTCASATVSGSGTVPVPMSNGLPRTYYPAAKLAGSGICNL